MPTLKHRHLEAQSGFSTLLALLAVMSFLMAMQYMQFNRKFAAKKLVKVEEEFDDVVQSRKAKQLFHDDEFCSHSTIIDGLKGWSFSQPSKRIIMKDAKEDTEFKVGSWGKKMFTPSSKFVTIHPTPDTSIKAERRTDSFHFLQDSESPVLTTVVEGLTYYRIPLLIRGYGYNEKWNSTLGSLEKHWGYTGEDFRKIYVEIDPVDTTKPVACYEKLSSRSTCLDSGGRFNPAATPKCYIPKH